MPLTFSDAPLRNNHSFLERQRAHVALCEAYIAKAGEKGTQFPCDAANEADAFYAARQDRMDKAALAVLANLWCTNRPTELKTPEDVVEANALLRQLASESWQVALALEQCRIGYDDAAFRGKRAQEAAAKAKLEVKEDVVVPNDA